MDLVVRGDSGGTPSNVRITQNAASCLYYPSRTTLSLTAVQGYDDRECIRVTTKPSGCQFIARYPSWIYPSWGPATWSDGASVCFSWFSNYGGTQRKGEILFEGLSGVNPPGRVAVTQVER